MKEGTLKRILAITREPRAVVESKVSDLEAQGLETAEVFRRLTAGKGVPSTHVSGQTDGDLIEGVVRTTKRVRPWHFGRR
jgi:hypothetical protein